MPPNPNDGTQLGTGEIISDEYIDPQTGGRRDANLPPTGYKVPRSKLVTGPYGQDGGDASHDNPVPVEARSDRQLQEMMALRDRYDAIGLMVSRTGERLTLADARGHSLTTRGVR